MTWSYRVVKTLDGEFGIKEIYWKDSADKLDPNKLSYKHIDYYTESFMTPWGSTKAELVKVMSYFMRALIRPVLSEKKIIATLHDVKET